MRITKRHYRDGTPYYEAFGYCMGEKVEAEALDRLSAIIGWINNANEAATKWPK